jgi:hypothetical protein
VVEGVFVSLQCNNVGNLILTDCVAYDKVLFQERYATVVDVIKREFCTVVLYPDPVDIFCCNFCGCECSCCLRESNK